MPITRHTGKFIVHEHKLKPITGRVLLLGRQTVFMTPLDAITMMKSLGVNIRSNVKIDLSTARDAPKDTFISDISFFSLFTDAEILSCDVSDYEGADFIFDITKNIPTHLKESFDFIYNGSVLDNVFDPASALKNTTALLNTEGRILHNEGVQHSGGAYFRMSPDWFYDYYAANNFFDCQTYVCTHNNVYNSDWLVFEYNPYYESSRGVEITPPLRIRNDANLLCLAEKGVFASSDLSPIQSPYRDDHSKYFTYSNRVKTSKRRAHFRDLPTNNQDDSGHSFLGFI